jgi:putative glycosyltransferase (TIGR04372 family)
MHIPFHIVALPTGSLGHLVMDTEKILFAIDCWQEIEAFTPIFIVSAGPMSNGFFVSKIKEGFHFAPQIMGQYIHRLLRRFSKSYARRDSFINSKSHDFLKAIHSSPPLFEVDECYEEFWLFLNQQMKENCFHSFVCLVVRDDGYDTYLSRPLEDGLLQSTRHTNPQTFRESINLLNTLGYFVIRMGRHISSPIHYDNPGYLEFHTLCESYSDRLDFEIFSRCSFVVSTGSGPDNLGLFFRKQVLYVNTLPLSAVPNTQLCPMALVPYLVDSEGKTLALETIKTLYWDSGHARLKGLEIQIIPKNAQEILKFINEFLINKNLSNGRPFKSTKFVY